MSLPLADPSPAYALGLLADLTREQDALRAQLPQPSHGDAAGGDLTANIAAFAAAHAVLGSLRSEANQMARRLAEHNGAQAERMPKLAKLQERAAALALQQAATQDPIQARALRRGRAELMVQIEDVGREVTIRQTEAATAREALAALHKKLAQARAGQGVAQRQLDACHRQRARVHVHVRALTLRLMAAHAGLRLHPTHAGRPPKEALAHWSEEIIQVAAAARTLHGHMQAGHFAASDVEKVAGGRSCLTAEVLWALIALGRDDEARDSFAILCADHGFLHHIFHVYRAFAAGLMVAADVQPLAEVLRLHRRSQGLRGALADCLWAILHRDEAAYARALPQVVHLDALTWQRSETPALGLVSVLGCALLRLGHTQGFASAAQLAAQMGPTVPWGPWSVADGARLG